MGISFTDADTVRDRDLLLEYHCQTDYRCESPLEDLPDYAQYRERWFQTPQPGEFLALVQKSLEDSRTIFKLIVDGSGRGIGYLWVTFRDVPAYNFRFAEIEDLFVEETYRRQGVASAALHLVEREALRLGVKVLRSGTGGANLASMKLHEKAGYTVYRYEYEKRL